MPYDPNQGPPDGETPETRDPKDPPHSVLRPEVRRGALITYLGGIVALFVVVGFGLLYWTLRDRAAIDDPTNTHATVGTAGEQLPGGFDPQPPYSSTGEELERRGAGEPGQDPMPPLAQGSALNELAALLDEPQTVIGRKVNLRDLDVESADGDMFWVRDDGARAAVVAPQGAPSVRAGMRVNVAGTAESDGSGGVRIRATTVETQ